MAEVAKVLLNQFRENFPTVGVSIVVFHNERALVLKRIDPPTIWWVPSGFVERGEDLAEAAKRELVEETGIKVEQVSMVGVFNLVFPEFHAVDIAFTAKVNSDFVTPNREFKEYRWIQVDNLANLHHYVVDEIKTAYDLVRRIAG